jgi:hypothetical protein
MRIVDGYLGLDVLDQRRVIFDFRAGTLTVTEAQGFFSSLWAHGNEAVVRTLGTSGRLRASNCRVNGVRAAAFGHRSHSHSKPGCHRPSPAEAPHPTCS